MQITFFSFVMSILWFNLYIIIINAFRKKDNFIISFNTLPLIFFLSISIFRLIFNFEISGAKIINSRNIFPVFYTFIKKSLYLNGYSMSVLEVFIYVWILVAVISLVKNIFIYNKLKKSLQKIDNNKIKENDKFFNEILKQTKMENKITIVQNSNISSPFIIGILKGKIYIPNIDFSREELEYIILHEINHFLKMDSLKKILIQSIKYVFWWNPFAHLFANNFNHILEIQCDLKTTAYFSDDKKIRYLESMTKIIKSSTNNILKYSSIPNFVNIDEIDSLKQRFRIVLHFKEKRNIFSIFNIGLCFLALCLFISSYFIIIQPEYMPPSTDIYPKEDTEEYFILEKSNGGYDIYINNIFRYSIENLEDLNEDLHDATIYKEERD